MKSRIVILIILFAVIVTTFGYFQINGDPADQLISILKLEEELNNRKSTEAEIASAQMDNMIEQMKVSYPNFSDSIANLLKPAFDNYINTISDSWEPSQVVNIYKESVYNNLTEKELSEALEYYNSERGRELLRLFHEATNKMNEYIQGQYSKASVVANQQLLNDIKAAMAPKLKFYDMQ